MSSEKGYFHPDEGYWQTTGEPGEDILNSYPDGTVEVPVKPNSDCSWDGTDWVPEGKNHLPAQVSEEAEQRIILGTKINGIQFKCDTDSISRLEGLLRGFERGIIGPEGKTYKTSAGVDLTFTTQEQVQTVLAAADDHRDWILERSAQIQNIEPIPDPTDDDLWEKPAA
ncbi:hypothetical protein [Pseudovibrio sp. Tun.PSC04-5.I4]|uniref:DUF4376 domain-containing protein n=1 Tax=Pseudovibrio sp. Tun.PSC04-5.I4 TaxID=1798213 RepID=UPI00088A2012|nr:hypothetical protein [Pseudovibrio sp. Tun.PSC04-5.I4]SDR07486.1 hypothetical protein SAMN04515695_2621 [Pseudovibrio sp. Tun.PSC04-5.I4]